MHIVIRLIPIRAPLMHVFAEVENSEGVRRACAHPQRSRHFPAPALKIFRTILWRVITPGRRPPLLSTARGTFPFRLRGQTLVAARHSRKPLAVFLRLHPTNGDNWMVRVIKTRLIPVGRRRMPGGLHENSKVPTAHREDRHR